MDSKTSELQELRNVESAAYRALEILEGNHRKMLAIAEITRWLTRNNSTVGVLRGDSPLNKFLHDTSEALCGALLDAHRILDDADRREDLPF